MGKYIGDETLSSTGYEIIQSKQTRCGSSSSSLYAKTTKIPIRSSEYTKHSVTRTASFPASKWSSLTSCGSSESVELDY